MITILRSSGHTLRIPGKSGKSDGITINNDDAIDNFVNSPSGNPKLSAGKNFSISRVEVPTASSVEIPSTESFVPSVGSDALGGYAYDTGLKDPITGRAMSFDDTGNGSWNSQIDKVNADLDSANAPQLPSKAYAATPAGKNDILKQKNYELANKDVTKGSMTGFETAKVGLGVVGAITNIASVAITAYYAQKNYDLQVKDREYAHARDAKNDAHQAQIQANFDNVG